MAVTTGLSFALSSISSILIFSGMQMYKPWLISSQVHVLFGGYLGSLLFTLTLTAVGNLEIILFGKGFQIKIFPEVVFCLLLSLFASVAIHQVCASSCLLISICSLYYMNKTSQKVYAAQVIQQPTHVVKKKKNAT